MSIDLAAAEELFAVSTDATVGLEEEFAILDAASLDLVPRFEELRDLAAADDPVLSEAIAGELISERDRDPLGPRRGRPRRAAPPARRPQPALRPRRVARGGAGRDRHPSVGRLPRAAQHRHRALPPRRRRPAVRRAAQQHVLAPRPRRRARRRPRGARLRPAAPGAPPAAQHQRQLALPRRPRQRAALGALAGLHQELPALRDPRRLRLVAGLPRLHRLPDPHRVDHRVHAGVVVDPPAPVVRDGRGAHLRRAEHRGRVRGAQRR